MKLYMAEDIYQVYAPRLKPLDEYDIDFHNMYVNPEVQQAFKQANQRYLHWEDLQHKSWLPNALKNNKDAFWGLLSFQRFVNSIDTPIKDKHDQTFRINTSQYQAFLHSIDKSMAGNFMGIQNFSETNKQQFVARNLIEEAIASSQLEGANTSRAVAKKMLLEGRKPTTQSEQMITNNHQAMLKIEQEFYQQPLSMELLFELHAIITNKTMTTDKQGCLRDTLDAQGEKLKVIPWQGAVAYIAPDRDFVEQQLPRLIAFANDELESSEEFIHPLIKGIMLHFWIGLLHPFEDGNGRLARIVFYWYMIKNDYWAFKYIALSEKIKKSNKQYAMAYIYSEQAHCDLTYFIHYNIEKLKQARDEFQQYINRKMSENRFVNSQQQEKYQLNERQLKLLHSFHQTAMERTNLNAYQKNYSVKQGTAIKDLNDLLGKGFIHKKKLGRNTYYYPEQNAEKLFF